MSNQKIDVSVSTIIRLLLILAGAWFLYSIRDVLVLLFLVVIIVAGLSPTVDRWARTITRPGAVISVFLLFLMVMGGILSLVVPPFIEQLREFTNNLPLYAEQLSNSSQQGFLSDATKLVVANLNDVVAQLSDISGTIFTKTIGVVNGLVAVVTILVLAFYLLLEEEGLKKMYKGIMPSSWYHNLTETTRKITGRLGAWLRAQIFLMVVVGFAVTVGLLIIGSPYALTLGIWAGLTEAIPIVGPWIGALPGVAVGLAVSPLQGFLTLLVYLIIQQLEGNILVPKIMSKAVGLNPVIVIIAILIGSKLYGLLGIVLAVPLAATISVIAEDWTIISQTFSRHHKE